MTISSRRGKTNIKHIEQARAEVVVNGKKAIMSLDWEKPSRFYIHIRGPGINKVITEEPDPRAILMAWTKALKKYQGSQVARTPKQKDLLQRQRQLASSFRDLCSAYFAPEFLEAMRLAYLYGLRRQAFEAEAAASGYQAFMKKKLKEWGIKSPFEMDDAKKKKFFAEIDREWKSKDEKKGVVQAGDPQIAKTILKQLGGSGRLKAMLGAKNFLDQGNGLSFQFPNPKRNKSNVFKVTLDKGSDTYILEFGKRAKYDYKKLKEYRGVYADKMKPIFEKFTGLRLSL